MLIHEDFFKNIFNAVREAILILDENMRVLSANRSFYTIFKVDAADTIGSLLYDLGNGQWNITHLRVLLEDVLPKNDTVDDYEIEHVFENIGRKTMLLNALKIREKDNDQSIILLAIEDITERKRLEELLTDSEERYRRLFETASDGIVLLEKREGTITHANPAAEQMLGYSEEECIGKNLKDIGVSVDTSDFPAMMESLGKSGIINYDDVLVKTKSGHYIDTDIYMVDRAMLAQCNIRDITTRKRANEELRESEERFRQIAESTEEWIWEVNNDGLYTYSNKVVEKLLGYKSENIVGKMHFYDFFPYDTREQMKKKAFEVFASKKAFTKHVNSNEHENGGIIILETSGEPILDSSGELLGYRGIDVNVTECRKLEEQLRHSQKMEAVGTLAGGIAHDFNNILSVIMGYGSLVFNKLEAGTPSKEHMSEVLIAADRAAELTKRLLVFSRKQVVEVKAVDINAVILGLQKMFVRIIPESIDFNLHLAENPLAVLADARQLEQVLINLASNAKDAMHEGGRLTISTVIEELDDEYVAVNGYGQPGRYALITVADSGHGMDAETRKKIFEPFFTTKGIGEGTGLGLAITYSIIKQHGGFINVCSEPGQGTAFKIYLPLSEEAASPARSTEAAIPVKGGNEILLVAEDDASLRHLAVEVLESSGYTVISAENGEDAIMKFMENRKRISLVLLDMIMPKKNGKEVRDAIRKVSPGIKILFSSGYTMDIIKTRELMETDFDFIQKPFLPKDLLIKVREILDR